MTDTALVAVAVVQGLAIIGGGFYFTGRITAVLEQLKEISSDHEERLRNLEQ